MRKEELENILKWQETKTEWYSVYEIKETAIQDKFIECFDTKQEAEEFINEKEYRRNNYYWIKIVPGRYDLSEHYPAFLEYLEEKLKNKE